MGLGGFSELWPWALIITQEGLTISLMLKEFRGDKVELLSLEFYFDESSFIIANLVSLHLLDFESTCSTVSGGLIRGGSYFFVTVE